MTFRWPWVLRSFNEHQLKVCYAAMEDADNLLAREQKRFDALLEKYHALRQEGFAVPNPVTPRDRKEIDPLTQAVLDASRGKPASIRNAMLKQLNEDKKAVELGTMEVADVLRRIEIGFTPDDGIPE